MQTMGVAEASLPCADVHVVGVIGWPGNPTNVGAFHPRDILQVGPREENAQEARGAATSGHEDLVSMYRHVEI